MASCLSSHPFTRGESYVLANAIPSHEEGHRSQMIHNVRHLNYGAGGKKASWQDRCKFLGNWPCTQLSLIELIETLIYLCLLFENFCTPPTRPVSNCSVASCASLKDVPLGDFGYSHCEEATYLRRSSVGAGLLSSTSIVEIVRLDWDHLSCLFYFTVNHQFKAGGGDLRPHPPHMIEVLRS